MIPDELILKYYQTKFPEEALPSESRWRQFKFRTYTGIDKTKKKYLSFMNLHWYIVHDKINNKKDLLKEIERCTNKFGVPKDIYYTVSRWLSPETLKTKRHAKWTPMYKTADNNFLGSEFVMDFDANTEDEVIVLKENLDIAVAILNAKGYEDLTFVRTGRGVQIHVNDWEEKTIKRQFCWPGERENYYKQMAQNTVAILKREGAVFDYGVSCDMRRVVRLPYSVHGSSGIICVSTSNLKYLFPPQEQTQPKKLCTFEQAIPA